MSRINQEKVFITSEELFDRTNGGLDVFQREIPDFCLRKNIKNPFVNERNPSARIKQSKSGLWLLNVYNDEGGYYNAIQFIQKKYGLTFKQAIEYITSNQNLTPIIKIKPIIKKELYYDVGICPFKKEHKDYYCIKGITEEFLNNMDIYAIDSYAINKLSHIHI